MGDPGVALVAPWAPMCLLLGLFVLFGKLWPSRLGIVATILCAIGYYLRWRLFDTIPWSGSAADLLWPLTCLTVEMAALFDGLILLAILSRPTDRSAEADAGEARLRALWQQNPALLPAVDIFIATYNEPREVLEKTVLGCLAMHWPETRVWVLDDGRRKWVHDFCIAKGAGYITRPDNKGAKAGNINHALTVTDAPFVTVFDADFVPRRDFLLRTMGFFDDAKIGIVQVPHSFYNHDPLQTNLGLENAMPDDQRFFFEAIMPGRDGWNAAFCCGSNSVSRRAIFEGIGGGLPEGSITEDMLLTLASLRQGYVTRYLNERLANGLAPESTAAFFVQRQRWAQGAIQILYLPQGPLGPGLRMRYRLLFLPTAWITQGLQVLFSIATPILFLLFDLSPMVGVDMASVVHYVLPMIVAMVGGITLLAPGRYYPLASQILSVFQSFRILPVALQTLLRPRGLIFKVTPKGANAGGSSWEGSILLSAAILMALTTAGLAVNLSPDYRIVSQEGMMPLVAAWSMLNLLLLALVAMMCMERRRRRGEERFAMDTKVTILGDSGAMAEASRGDISISGIGLRTEDASLFRPGERVQLLVPEVGMVRGTVKRVAGQLVGIAFDFQSEALRDRLIVALFTREMSVNTRRPSALAVAGAMIQRIWAADLTAHDDPVVATPEPTVEKLTAEPRKIAPAVAVAQGILDDDAHQYQNIRTGT